MVLNEWMDRFVWWYVGFWKRLSVGGKRWRPVLVLLVAQALTDIAADKKIEDAVLACAYLCELVHNGSLVVDDIEDDSKMRRGKPCIHLIYNTDVAVNAGNAMYFMPLNVIKGLRKAGFSEETVLRAYELYSEELINLHVGQGLDIWWHSGKKQPNVDEYLQMCAYKTGTLARLSAKLSALVAGADAKQIEAFGRFAEAIGVAFQIQDDLLNIAGDKFAEKIAVKGEDVHEGKRTLMVIHATEHATPEKAKRLDEILRLHTNDQALINEAIDIMVEAKSLEYATQVARDIVTKAWAELESSLPTENQAKSRLRAFANYLIQRDY